MTNRFTYRPSPPKPPPICKKPPAPTPLHYRDIIPWFRGISIWQGNDGTTDFHETQTWVMTPLFVDHQPPPRNPSPAYLEALWRDKPPIDYEATNVFEQPPEQQIAWYLLQGWQTWYADIVLLLAGDPEYHAHVATRPWAYTQPWDSGLLYATPLELSTGPLVRLMS